MLHTPAWLQAESAERPRCFDRVAIGGSNSVTHDLAATHDLVNAHEVADALNGNPRPNGGSDPSAVLFLRRWAVLRLDLENLRGLWPGAIQ